MSQISYKARYTVFGYRFGTADVTNAGIAS
jgi:hypothetical protein